MPRQYRIAASLRLTCNILGISPARVLRRAGLPGDYLDNEGKGVDARAFFDVWRAVSEESTDPNMPLTLGRGASRGPFQPALLAFSSSPDIHTGLTRLSLFKPLVAPISLRLDETGDGFSVGLEPEAGAAMPDVLAATEIVFLLDFARSLTAHRIVPRSVRLPNADHATPAYRAYVGAPIEFGGTAAMTFAMEDARRPLISADTEFYKLVEQELMARLDDGPSDRSLTDRVRKALIELLPSGLASAEEVSLRLRISKRSLQRKLKEEGASFQAILDETRASLALTYLRDHQLSAEETSYLLAFRDPNSFYRAFHDWTGMTPAQARKAPIQGLAQSVIPMARSAIV